jgi:hypothetical protein
VGDHAGAASARASAHGSSLSLDTDNFKDNEVSSDSSGGGKLHSLSHSLFIGGDAGSASSGGGLGNGPGQGNFVVSSGAGRAVIGVSPQFSTLMPANENSNSLSMSFDFTPPEIIETRDAVLLEIMTSKDTSRVGELGEIDVGLQRPYNRTKVDAVNLLAASGKQTEEKLDALVRIVKMQQRAKKD